MLRPFVAYLRVYEPLAAFGDPSDQELLAAVQAPTVTRATVGERERTMWLRSQSVTPTRLLPAELPDGRAAPSTRTDVLVLDPADVPTEDGTELGDGPLVCPLEVRARSAAALAGFVGGSDPANPALRAEVLSASGTAEGDVRTRTTAAIRDLRTGSVHTLSTTWTVPLPWFCLVDPAQRRLHLGAGPGDPRRELSWRVALPDARARVSDCRELLEGAIGDAGPARILAETDRWLGNFHAGSALELDYGGLVQLMSDEALDADDSADQVHLIIEALRGNDIDELTTRFNDLRAYWAEIAGYERYN